MSNGATGAGGSCGCSVLQRDASKGVPGRKTAQRYLGGPEDMEVAVLSGGSLQYQFLVPVPTCFTYLLSRDAV